MINCKDFYKKLKEKEVNFYTGVPDSLLKDFCAYLLDNVEEKNNIIAANEGNAIALAAGYHLATNKIGIVYMQNSGQGNCMNPLISLTDKEVYNIPMLLLIGWRGEPGKKDEPQHKKQGMVTTGLLDAIGMKYEILSDEIDKAKETIDTAVSKIKETNEPYALIVRKGLFESYSAEKANSICQYDMSREDAVKIVANEIGLDAVIVSTTGKTSRELFEYREEKSQGHANDFLTVGSMGHSSSIALGIALQKPNKQVYCFDGDGAALMHMGSMGITGALEPKNFKHIIFNNCAHDSVGGQPTVAETMDFEKIAQGCNYKEIMSCETESQLKEKIKILKECEGPALLEIKVNKGARKDLGRPTTTPIENKKAFMEFLSKDD